MLHQGDHLEGEVSIPSSDVRGGWSVQPEAGKELLLSRLEKFNIIIIVLPFFNLNRSKIVLGHYFANNNLRNLWN